MKLLLVYSSAKPESKNWYREIADEAAPYITVTTFCITPNSPRGPFNWKELHERWSSGDHELMSVYRRLVDIAQDYDVLINYNGVNLHPDLLPCLPTFNVYSCFDDPESSDWLSAPVAAKFDAVFHGNIASEFQYLNWGCKKLAFLPIFTAPSDIPKPEESDGVLHKSRPYDICFVGEINRWRKKRLHTLAETFPQTISYGHGWPRGKATEAQKRELYLNCKLSWNIHNSTGPINRRLYELAAYGVFQLCDNKTGLGKIFKLDEEIVGFDTIPEAIELTNYYLQHETERRAIVENAYKRYWNNYCAKSIWRGIIKQLEDWDAHRQPARNRLPACSFPKRIFFSAQTIQSKLKCAKKIAKLCYDQINPLPTESQSFDERAYLDQMPPPYTENPEMAHVNMAKYRLEVGEPFEWPNILALNWAVASRIGKAKRIIEIGSGTGAFAEYSSVDASRTIYCIEGDDFARGEAMKSRNRTNVHYFKDMHDCTIKKFDLLVSIEVIEHVYNLNAFLKFCIELAPRAIFSTPNRQILRSPKDLGPPAYPPHVREFDPGEIYWILRQYYNVIKLFYMPDQYVPWLAPMTIATKGTPIIAECMEPVISS